MKFRQFLNPFCNANHEAINFQLIIFCLAQNLFAFIRQREPDSCPSSNVNERTKKNYANRWRKLSLGSPLGCQHPRQIMRDRIAIIQELSKQRADAENQIWNEMLFPKTILLISSHWVCSWLDYHLTFADLCRVCSKRQWNSCKNSLETNSKLKLISFPRLRRVVHSNIYANHKLNWWQQQCDVDIHKFMTKMFVIN